MSIWFDSTFCCSSPIYLWENNPYFCYIQFLTLIWLISHRIALFQMSHFQNTRDKDFIKKTEMDFLSDFISFCFNCAGHFFVNFCFFRQRFPKLIFSKTKSPRIDPFVSFILLRNRTKIDKGQGAKKRRSDGRSSAANSFKKMENK